MNISWYCFATFTFAIIFISVTASSDVDQTRLECKDMDGEIKLFIFREKTKKNKDCDWIKKHFKRWCTVEIVRNHCIKLCNNCPFSPPPELFGLIPVKSSSTAWSESVAFAEVETDLERLGSLSYSEEGKKKERKMQNAMDAYAINSEKGIVREYVQLCRMYADLLRKIPGISNKLRDGFYGSMMKIALGLNGTHTEMESQIKGVKMRGWPFKIATDDVPEFEAYQAGSLMEAIALAAEQAVIHGDKETAVSLALTVAGALHDGFLTKDLKRTKVRNDGTVVYVPNSAPEDRMKRFKEVYKEKYSGRPAFECPMLAQAINHGITPANAGIALLRAFGSIGWLKGKSKSEWNLIDADGVKIDLENYIEILKDFVSKSADVLLGNCKIRKTGTSIKDNYAGLDGKEWYHWKYKKISAKKCPSFKKDLSNRPEDISHGVIELQFASKIRAVGSDYFNRDPNYFGISDVDIHRFLMSVLNRFIVDPNAKVDDRFSCDLDSETRPNSKSCANGRTMPKRLMSVSQLLDIAIAARDYPEVRCDVLSVVNAILPIFLEGHKDFHGIFKYNKIKHLVAPLMSKYYFYWYESGVIDCQKE